MQIEPINLTGLILGALGISIVLIPVIGLTARFALTPLVDAMSRLFESRGAEESLQIMEQRIQLQEQQIAALQSSVRSLVEGRDFERQLKAPTDGGGSAAPDPRPTA